MERLDWSRLGNIQVGRPNLGMLTRVEMYRLLQYSMRSALDEAYDASVARKILHRAGELSGIAFAQEFLDLSQPLNKFLADLHEQLRDLSMGILRVEKMDPDTLTLTVTVSEDLDCSGLPVNGTTVCDYDEGFLAGVFKTYTGKDFEVHEIDCWSTGDRTCRFTLEPI